MIYFFDDDTSLAGATASRFYTGKNKAAKKLNIYIGFIHCQKYGSKKLMSSRSDSYCSLYKKAADEYYDLEPFYTINGSKKTRKRVAGVAWIASGMKTMGVSPDYNEENMSFACSAVWQRLNPAVSNTSRYAGVLNLCAEKYVFYDVSNAAMLWQHEAEKSIFTETPRNRNVVLDGILTLADKPLTEQTIDITLRSIKK